MNKIAMSKNFLTASALFDTALREAIIGGVYLEFGILSGRSINLITNFDYDTLYGFDSIRPNPEEAKKYMNKRISFLHVDSGLRHETRRVLDLLSASIVTGTVIVFEEFISERRGGLSEHQVWEEFANEAEISYDYIGYTFTRQVAIRVTGR